MLDYKDLEILEALKNNLNTKFVKIKDLLNYIKISRNHFYYHLKHINGILKKENLTLDVNNLSQNNLHKIYNIAFSMENIFINNNISWYILTFYVLLNDYVKLNIISKLLNISINNAFKIIKKINKIIKEKYKYKNLVICNDGNGYYFYGNELLKRKLIINLSIQIFNNKSNKLILEFIFTKFNLQYKKQDFLKIQNIIIFYKKQLSFIDLTLDVLSFIIYFFLIYKNKFINNDKIYQKIKNKQFYLNQQSYINANNIINKICENFNISFNSNNFEKFFLSCIIFSKQNIIIDDLDINYQKIIKYINTMFINLTIQGYIINNIAKKYVANYLMYINHKWYFSWINDDSIYLINNFIKSKDNYLLLYNFLLKYINSFNTIMNNKKILKNQIADITVILISHIQSFPKQIINWNKNNNQAIIITSLKGNLINLLKAKAVEIFPMLYIDQIISNYEYQNNKYFFKNYYKISDNIDIQKEIKGIYFLLTTTFEDMLKKNNISNLIFNNLFNLETAEKFLYKILKCDLTVQEKVNILLQIIYLIKNIRQINYKICVK